MVRQARVPILLLIFLMGCQSDPPEKSSAPEQTHEATAPTTPAGPKPKNLRAGGADETAEDKVCREFLHNSSECARIESRAADTNFSDEFVRNCKKEMTRTTHYAKAFADCARQTTCDQLARCTAGLERATLEYGPEHIRYLLKRGARTDAQRFCFSNRHLVEKSEPPDSVCHGLLEEMARQKGQQQHICPFHEH